MGVHGQWAMGWARRGWSTQNRFTVTKICGTHLPNCGVHLIVVRRWHKYVREGIVLFVGPDGIVSDQYLAEIAVRETLEVSAFIGWLIVTEVKRESCRGAHHGPFKKALQQTTVMHCWCDGH